jgi:hypothetical protein
LRLWAEGGREEILAPHLDDYARAADLGWREERGYLQQVFNEFHARVDWKLQDHEEPILLPFDPDAVRIKPVLDPQEEVAKRTRLEELNSVCDPSVT